MKTLFTRTRGLKHDNADGHMDVWSQVCLFIGTSILKGTSPIFFFSSWCRRKRWKSLFRTMTVTMLSVDVKSHNSCGVRNGYDYSPLPQYVFDTVLRERLWSERHRVDQPRKCEWTSTFRKRWFRSYITEFLHWRKSFRVSGCVSVFFVLFRSLYCGSLCY